ncbi:MAG: hypothetical protein E6772_15935 [Dysgonomonas sp.]|nr:hypothetical protein [Dysgonomonas sp.]
MNTKNNDFSYLIEQACTAISESHIEVRERYKDFPLCLMELIADGIHREQIEVSFDKQNGSVTYFFDKNRIVECSSICLYELSDTDLFIVYLEQFADSYNYIKKHWIINQQYYMTANEMERCVHFYCYKFAINQ